jgi:hypothetical protein
MIKNKLGVSTVVATVIIIALTVTTGAIVWSIVSNLVSEQLEEGQECFGVLDQVQLNNDFTCYNATSDRMQFSINVGDINITGILISVSFAGTSKSITLTKDNQTISDVKNYPSGSNGVKMPGKNAGLTYFFEGIDSYPASVSIIPIVKKEQCGSSDTIHEIDDCQAIITP